MNPLTERQQEVLAFIKRHLKTEGFPPTTWEISQHFGWSSANAARSHLKLIERKGCIRVSKRIARGIVVL